MKTTQNLTQIFNSDYFQWLIDNIPGHESYSMLLYSMFSKDYYYDKNIAIDSCRADDGINMRYLYLENDTPEDKRVYFYSRPCTVLEWLLGMAKRCEDTVMFNEDEGDRTMLWFWSMIDNMGFSKYTDSAWNAQIQANINDRLDDILSRRIPSDGAGTPFPISETPENMQKCDWWRALNLWLNENFSDEFDCDFDNF